jgi:hypothetical protein
MAEADARVANWVDREFVDLEAFVSCSKGSSN